MTETKNPPPKSVLEAFGDDATARLLPGGQGETWCAGTLVLKRMFDPERAIWEAETLTSLPCDGYRIAAPVRSSFETWEVEGWTASRFVAGEGQMGTHLAERLAAARAFHRDLAGRARPGHFDRATDPWDLADRVAFGLIPWTPDPRIAGCLDRFRARQEKPGTDWQVIHGDLAGNFLVQDGVAPAVIDFTPKWSPLGFGEAVMGVDVFLWEGISWHEVRELLSPEEFSLVPLAAARRLLEVDTRHKRLGLAETVFEQVAAYERLADRLDGLGLA